MAKQEQTEVRGWHCRSDISLFTLLVLLYHFAQNVTHYAKSSCVSLQLATANKALVAQNSKLKYQVDVLKQAVREGDEKLRLATTAK